MNPYEGVSIKVERKDLPFREVLLDNAEIIMPYRESGVLDDYVVTGRVEKVDRMKVLDEKLLEITVRNRVLGVMDVIVNGRNVAGNMEEGMMVEAVGWLEGKMSGEKWKTLITETSRHPFSFWNRGRLQNPERPLK